MRILCWLMEKYLCLAIGRPVLCPPWERKRGEIQAIYQEGGLIEWSWLDPLESKV